MNTSLFSADFILPEARSRWMKLIGNSIAVSLVKMLAQSVVNTGVFGDEEYVESAEDEKPVQVGEFQGLLFDF